VLRGGTTATVAWTAPQLPTFVEEWEAFLSVDGGRYYGYRITPHLDIARRSFTFEVPNVEAEQARIFIRAGNERREIELDAAVTFTIERDQARALAALPLEIAEGRRGEAARQGDRGVIEWIEGNRDGSNLTECSALQRRSAFTRAPQLQQTLDSVEETDDRPSADRTETFRSVENISFPVTRVRSGHRTGREVLLAHRRLNI
jgi:hypothetical protein